MESIAIIGSGIAGLTIANKLKDVADITIFEKSRGVGGRLATRRSKPFRFDHGVQFFTAKTANFKALVTEMLQANVIERWDAKFIEINDGNITNTRTWDAEYPHYVGVPAMNTVGKYLAQNLDVRLQTKVARMHHNKKWHLYDDNNQLLGAFDWVIVTAPAAQTHDLLPQNTPLKTTSGQKKMLACFSLMIGFNKVIDFGFEAALVKNADISWISINSSKPQRANRQTTLLVHSTNVWAEANFALEKQEVIDYLLNQTQKVIDQSLQKANHIDVHGWRYANIGKQQMAQPLIDYNNKLAACGDWCKHGRVEAAFDTASKTANKLLEVMKS